MFFLLLLSVLQICFIPGFILFVLLNRKRDDITILLAPVFSFALSLLVNYIVIQALIVLHLYNRTTLSVFIFLELLILAVIILFRKAGINEFNFNRRFRKLLEESSLHLNFRGSVYNIIKSILFIVAVLVLTGMTVQMILNIGKIFNGWDAVFSWNRWAIDIFNNKIPSSTYHYPQLIPANWSVSYVLCGYPLQFIPKAMMPLFLILQVYTFIVLAIKRNSFIYIFAVIFLFLGFNRLNWTEGFVDVPVAFYAILVYLTISLINNEDVEKDKIRYILLSLLFACASAVTKQAGIYVLLTFPLLLVLLTKNKIIWNNQKIIKIALLFFLFILIIVVPYYVYAEIAIRSGIAASEVPYVTKEIYDGASWTQRVINAVDLFSGIFSSRVLFLISILALLLSFTNRTYRILNFSFILPFLVIWALFFSYDLRNSAIVIPYFCLSIGAGLNIVLNRFHNFAGNEHSGQ